MYKASVDTSENWDTMIELISEYNLDAEDILQYLTDWHGLQLLDSNFMENLFEELGFETEDDDEEDE